MPISPANAARYPADWPEISRRIRFERAGGRCECQGECGYDHLGRCSAMHGQPHPFTGSHVVLTVGHLTHEPERSADHELRAWCQRCHLAYDRDHHLANVRRTSSLRRIAGAGTLELFEADLGDRTREPVMLPDVAPLPPAQPAAWPFSGLVAGHYGAILADPPWRFLNRSKAGELKNPVAHYPCMSIAELAALPVARLAAPDCALIMWATAPLLDRAIELLAAWGFTFKSAGAWAKRSKTGQRWTFGTGYVFRSAAEFYLVGTIGKPRVTSRSIRNLIEAPVREHSRKPDQMHADVEALYAGPYAELFARQRRPGWDAWGNDIDRFTDGG
ncbi:MULTISPECIES: MT-A70 family methyltransferase [unclassified Sphingomonas]|uniref:MT-A70 family methyltransferase n=1 Tax=unclassified Sphingomonas TaxID=196159 RepID=UPI00226A53FE|nr:MULTISPECIES: MT-A70 family methyltransferase [unclassified Sphingomonas]